MSDAANPLLVAALDYAAKGWPVFPCRARPETIEVEGKPRLYKAKTPIPPKGLKAATTDERIIRRWWAAHPDAMIGVPTGAAIGEFVVDLDAGVDKKTGEVFDLASLLDDLTIAVDYELPITRMSTTPRGGAHLWFAMPEGQDVRNRGGMLERIDVRGTGGFVIVPPSFNPDPHETGDEREGAAYAWSNSRPVAVPSPNLVRLVTEKLPRGRSAPDSDIAVRDYVEERSRIDSGAYVGRSSASFDELEAHARRVLDAELERVRTAREGTRNDTLNRAAFTMGGYVARGWLTRARVESELMVAAEAAGLVAADGLRSVEDTIASGITAGLARPVDESVVAAWAARGARGGGNARPRGAALPARERSSPRRAGSAASSSARGAPAAAPRPAPPASGVFSQPSRMGGFAPDDAVDLGGGVGGETEEELNVRLSFFPQTDLGNAERFLARFGGSFLYCAPLGGWLAWDGRRWNRPAADELVARAVYETIRAIGDEAAAVARAGVAWKREKGLTQAEEEERFKTRTLAEMSGALAKMTEEELAGIDGGPDPLLDIKSNGTRVRKSDRLKAWGRSSEGSGHLSCVAPIARPYLSVLEEEFDADPYLFNVLNGTLRFWRETGPDGRKVGRVELLEHHPEDRITKLAPVEYDPDATAPTYDAMLERVQPDEAMRQFLHAWAGYNMTGDISAQAIVFNYGTGANGKSTWVDAVADCLGDYGTTTAIETFLDQGRGRRGDQASPDLADLAGRRMVRTSEPEKGAKWAESLIKLATGGEPMKVRQLNCPFFELKVTFKLTVSGNHRPDLGTDHGIRRRMNLVPWDVTIPEGERDPELPAKMRRERSGILNRLVEGCLDWLANGLRFPMAVLEATTEYFEQTDPLGRFLALCVAPAAGERVQSSDMYRLFVAWAKWAGEKEWTQTGFSRAMGERGYRKKQSDVMVWLDVRLSKTIRDFEPDELDAPPAYDGPYD